MSRASADSQTPSDDSSSARVFVYGSLKNSYALHYLLEQQRFLGLAVTKPLYRIFDLGNYPGIVEWPVGLSIEGEVYAVDADCLRRLDDAEGVDEGCYARRPVLLQSPFDGQVIDAWFWLSSVEGLRDCGVSWP